MDENNGGGSGSENKALAKGINENISLIKEIFKDDETLVIRMMENQKDASIKCCLIYIDGMVNNKLMDDDLVRPIQEYRFPQKPAGLLDVIATQVTLSSSVEKTGDLEKITQAIVYGDSALIADGYPEVLILNAKGWATRAISEPENEKVLRGPREGFNEAIMPNLTMLRRRLRTADLKMKFRTFGTRTKTKACICYLDSLVNKNVLRELEKRLDQFSVDGTLDVNYINEYIRDFPYSPIKTIGSTERPDVVAGKILEGRVALFLDGTPMVLTLPYLFIENFQSDDDYYINYFFASIGRILRILAFLVTTSVPAIYVALVTFHQEMLPTPLLMSVDMARQNVPFPTVLEAVLMIIVFEMLREAGLRMPGSIGQALSIVGALVIGQAAVDARIISAPMVIIVGLTGITGLMIPRIKGAVILLRFFLLFTSSMLGLYGYMFGMLALLIHLYNLNSFGIPIMNSAYAENSQDNKDMYVRSPWRSMKKRPKFLSSDPPRNSSGGGGK